MAENRGGPLAGIKIEIAGIGPAPLCSSLLADMGVDIVRIDPPETLKAWGFSSDELATLKAEKAIGRQV